jgi:catechol 2,3-dioxygenase-like lactoylglutathione lyase family enzyme
VTATLREHAGESDRSFGCHICSSPVVIKSDDHKQGGPTVLEKVVYTSLYVSDQDRALDFYTNVLGFEPRIDNPTADGPRFLTVAVKGQDFELVLWPGTPGLAQPVQGRVPAAYTIETKDCRKAFDALKSRGVEFETEVLEHPWGYNAIFRDPDGNRLQIRQGR